MRGVRCDKDPMVTRWSIYIDIEGFSAKYEESDAALWALSKLMDGIYRVGTQYVFPDGNRIFAHQTGDGFIIVSDFAGDSLEIPVALGIVLLRHVATTGRFAKAAIAEGRFADVSGCYPKAVRDAQDDSGRVRLNEGFMTTFPVMGTALINAIATDKASPPGALFSMNRTLGSRVPSDYVTRPVGGTELLAIDWVNTNSALISEIQRAAGLEAPDAKRLRDLFGIYFFTQGVKDEWKANSNWLLSLRLAPNRT